MIYKTVLIDDEPNSLEQLKDKLRPYSDKLQIVGTANSAVRGLAIIRDFDPDVVFLDISMPGGTGFEMLDQLDDKNFEVIFISAHQKHAINAFDYEPVNYLLKPIDPKKLDKVIQRLISKDQDQPGILHAKADKLSISTNKGHRIISVNHIIRCEADGGYTFIHLEDGSKILSSQNIKIFENQLSLHAFARIHKKHLINLKKVKYFTKGKGGHVTLTDGSEVSISFRQKTNFIQKLQYYMSI